MSNVQAGNSVRVHYEGRFEDGEVFDTSRGREPLEFEAGSDQLIPGFSNAVIGMAVGESKTVTLSPAEAYGEHDPERVQRADREVLPDNVKVGDRLEARSGEHRIVVEVTALDDEGATLDANHPLAGRTLVFDIEVVALG
jgi:FKBP-type peptidyl-prolyl cis-trans isomerase 2